MSMELFLADGTLNVNVLQVIESQLNKKDSKPPRYAQS